MGDARRDAVEFDAGAARAGKELFGHQPEEVPDTDRGFEYPRSGFEAEAFQGLPDRLDDHGRREMRVRRRGARGGVFVFAEKLVKV